MANECFGCGQKHDENWPCPPYRRPYTPDEKKRYSARSKFLKSLDDISEGASPSSRTKLKMKKIYIRFGKIPVNGKSKNHLTNHLENGVSVYEGIEENGIYKLIFPSLTYSACVSLSGCIEREAYLVNGILIGRGSDGECLLKNCKIIKKIKIGPTGGTHTRTA